MIAAPAVDLRQGRCVQLVGGRPEDERVSLPDPVLQARRWWDAGFGTLHVVDLDAALSLGENRDLIRRVVEGTEAVVQVGGGIRDEAGVEAILELGARRAVVGTRAIDDPAWLDAVSNRFPDRVVVAADIRDGIVVRKGWTESTGIPITRLLARMDAFPLAGLLCTDVSREGRMEGADIQEARAVIDGTRHPVWISGGITTMEELRALDRSGAFGVVLGMALYTDTLPSEAVAKEFGQ